MSRGDPVADVEVIRTHPQVRCTQKPGIKMRQERPINSPRLAIVPLRTYIFVPKTTRAQDSRETGVIQYITIDSNLICHSCQKLDSISHLNTQAASLLRSLVLKRYRTDMDIIHEYNKEYDTALAT